jgi:hypothetical protein
MENFNNFFKYYLQTRKTINLNTQKAVREKGIQEPFLNVEIIEPKEIIKTKPNTYKVLRGEAKFKIGLNITCNYIKEKQKLEPEFKETLNGLKQKAKELNLNISERKDNLIISTVASYSDILKKGIRLEELKKMEETAERKKYIEEILLSKPRIKNKREMEKQWGEAFNQLQKHVNKIVGFEKKQKPLEITSKERKTMLKIVK